MIIVDQNISDILLIFSTALQILMKWSSSISIYQKYCSFHHVFVFEKIFKRWKEKKIFKPS